MTHDDDRTNQLLQELQAANEKYHSLFEGAGDSILIVDASSARILDANMNAIRRLKYSREELLALTISDIEVLPSADSQSDLAWMSAFSGTQVYECEYRRKDGVLVPVEVCSRVVH